MSGASAPNVADFVFRWLREAGTPDFLRGWSGQCAESCVGAEGRVVASVTVDGKVIPLAHGRARSNGMRLIWSI